MIIFLQMIETEEDWAKFEWIYDTYRGLVYSVIYNTVRHKEDTEDVLQDAFEMMIPYLSKIQQPRSPSTKRLLMTIVDHQVVNYLRKRKRCADQPIDEALIEESVFEIDESVLEGDLLALCIGRLPSQQRLIICLKYGLGYDLREIAKSLKISLCNAQKIDQRAKRKLEKLLKEANQ